MFLLALTDGYDAYTVICVGEDKDKLRSAAEEHNGSPLTWDSYDSDSSVGSPDYYAIEEVKLV